MENIKSCCIVLCNKNKQSEKIKTGLFDLLNKLIKKENVVNIYFYDIYESEDWLLTEFSKLQTTFPQLKYINNKSDLNFKLSNHNSPIYNY